MIMRYARVLSRLKPIKFLLPNPDLRPFLGEANEGVGDAFLQCGNTMLVSRTTRIDAFSHRDLLIEITASFVPRQKRTVCPHWSKE
jgi:hypothetical protein